MPMSRPPKSARLLRELLPGPDGRVRQEFRAGGAKTGNAEGGSWVSITKGAEMLAEGSDIIESERYGLAGTYSMLTDGLMRYATRQREKR